VLYTTTVDYISTSLAWLVCCGWVLVCYCLLGKRFV